jgi:hypothetical protein
VKLTVATTQSNDPEVHAFGCADVKRGRRSGKYARAISIQVGEVADAARWFWEDFLPGGCAYEEGGPGTGMTDEDAQGYTKYLPCTGRAGRDKKETEMTATATKTETQKATTQAEAAEAALLNGVVRTDPKPAKTPKPKTEKAPAPAKAPVSTTEKMLRPATKTVTGYVSWLKSELGSAEWAKLAKDPERLAQVSLTNYGSYRASK